MSPPAAGGKGVCRRTPQSWEGHLAGMEMEYYQIEKMTIWINCPPSDSRSSAFSKDQGARAGCLIAVL